MASALRSSFSGWKGSRKGCDFSQVERNREGREFLSVWFLLWDIWLQVRDVHLFSHLFVFLNRFIAMVGKRFYTGREQITKEWEKKMADKQSYWVWWQILKGETNKSHKGWCPSVSCLWSPAQKEFWGIFCLKCSQSASHKLWTGSEKGSKVLLGMKRRPTKRYYGATLKFPTCPLEPLSRIWGQTTASTTHHCMKSAVRNRLSVTPFER